MIASPETRNRALFWAATSLIMGCLVAGVVRADPGPVFKLKVVVARLTDGQKTIDKGAKRLHAALKKQFRYEGIRVVETRKVSLVVDEVWDLNLPTRRRLRLRPLVVEENGALVSVEISGLVQSDLRINKGQLVIIGVEQYGDGKLVIALQARR